MNLIKRSRGWTCSKNRSTGWEPSSKIGARCWNLFKNRGCKPCSKIGAGIEICRNWSSSCFKLYFRSSRGHGFFFSIVLLFVFPFPFLRSWLFPFPFLRSWCSGFIVTLVALWDCPVPDQQLVDLGLFLQRKDEPC